MPGAGLKWRCGVLRANCGRKSARAAVWDHTRVSGRPTPELRGAAKRHPLERIVRHQVYASPRKTKRQRLRTRGRRSNLQTCRATEWPRQAPQQSGRGL